MPSLSFIVPARSQTEMTFGCISSILASLRQLGIEKHAEFILLDDNSDASEGVLTLFRSVRQSTPAPVHIARFLQRQHYTGVFAYGLSRAAGELVFFISNDMVVTPWWMRTIIAVGALDPTYGIVRGTAEIVDSHPEHQFNPPFPLRHDADISEFSRFMADAAGLHHEEDKLLSGDAVLIKRSLIQKIGVMDRQFYGYFGDPDFGLRAQRAGFKLICANGAWLKHHGQGHIKAETQKQKISMDHAHAQRMRLVHAAYAKFRAKWDPSLPAEYTSTESIDFARLRAIPRPDGWDYIAPIADEKGLVELH